MVPLAPFAPTRPERRGSRSIREAHCTAPFACAQNGLYQPDPDRALETSKGSADAAAPAAAPAYLVEVDSIHFV